MDRKKKPLRVSCILLWYPLFTQPFIFREVEGLRDECELSVFTLYGENLRHCSKEMRARAKGVTRLGLGALPKILFLILREICLRPRRFFSLLNSSLHRSWPSLEVFGENLWAFAAGFLLNDLLREVKTDVIYAPWPRGTAQAALTVSRLSGIPFVMTVRGDNLEPPDPDLGSKMKAAAKIRANNLADMKRIEAFGLGEAKGKTELIYNSLTLTDLPESPARIKDYGPERPLKLMALGRFDVTKGFDVLIRACAILRDEGLSFTLTLAGGGGIAMGLGGLEGELKSLTKNLGLDRQISFPGLISHNDLPRILTAHDIFVAPCVVDKSGRRDGIPNTVIEAMSLGLPVVASRLHALPEIVRHGETGYTVLPGDPRALADGIRYLAEHPDKASDYGARARALALSLFSPEENCRKLATLLEKAARADG